jgi:serine/threonine protein kinase/tetratricopeptide (TPR) repeat protein
MKQTLTCPRGHHWEKAAGSPASCPHCTAAAGPAPQRPSEADDRLASALLSYQRAVEAGERPERDGFLRRHADIADQLEPLLSAGEHADALLTPLQALAARPEQAAALSSASSTVPFRPSIEAAGATIAGKYKLLEEIGEGGMGTVWVAEQTKPVKRKVALKLIKAGTDSRSVLARFEAERQALALMDHPNIAKVLDGGLTEGSRPFFVMDYVKGVPITEYCDGTRLSIGERLNLFVQVCSAVQHAHQKGIIHRDLKPANILVAPYDDKPVPKVIDFGLAKAMHQPLTERTLHTAHEMVLGTPLYMSPEQAQLNNIDVDTRTDVYSLGVVLYELLTGTTPLERQQFKQAAWDEMRRLIREEEPPRPSARLSSSATLASLAASRRSEPKTLTRQLRGELDWVVMKALEKDRTRRYDTANGLARDVQRYLADEIVEARPPTTAYRLKKFVRRHRGQVLAASLVLLALVMGVIGTTIGMVQANEAKLREAKRAEGEQKAKENVYAKRQEAERNLEFARKANKILGSVFAGLDPETNYETVADLRNALRDNLTKAVKELEGSAIGHPLEVAEMQNTLGLSLLALAEASLAVEVFEKALETRKANLGPNLSDTLTSMNHLANAYRASGQLVKAVALHEETLEKTKAILGPEHPRTLVIMNNLGLDYEASGQQAKATALFEETLEKWKAKRAYIAGGTMLANVLPSMEKELEKVKANLGPDHLDTLKKMDNLAKAFISFGEYAKAVSLFKETLEKQKVKLGSDHPSTLVTMSNLAGAYQASGQFARAVPLFEEALEKRRANLGPDHLDTLKSMSNLANAFKSSGEFAKAVSLFKETLEKQKVKLGPDDPSTLVTMNNLAGAYQASGQLAKAVPLFEETLEKQKVKLVPDHPSTLVTMNNLAGAYQASGQLAKAVTLFEETLEKRKAKLGPDHPATLSSMNDLADAYRVSGQLAKAVELSPDHLDVLTSMNNLANAYISSGQFAKAVALHEETLEKRKAKFGPDHPSTLSSMSNLASAYQASGQLAKAVTVFQETLEKRKAKLGPDHPATLSSATNLARAYVATGQLAKAVALHEETLEKTKAKLGPDHPNTLISMTDLADAYRASGQLAKAVPLFEETLEKQKVKLGPDHPSTLVTTNNLGWAYQASGQLAKAVSVFEETLEKRKVKLGPEHPDTLITMKDLAVAYKGSGQLAKAVPLFEETLEKQKVKLGPDHPDTLTSMGDLGRAYAEAKQVEKAAATLGAFVDAKRKSEPKDSAQFAELLAQVSLALLGCGQHAAAEPLLHECLAIREQTQPDAWATFNTMSILGGALLGQKKYADAKPLLIKGYEGMKAREKAIPQSGDVVLWIPTALDRLIELCTLTDRPDEAQKWQAERAKYPKSTASPEKK